MSREDKLAKLRSRHEALCEQINEGSEHPAFNRREAIRQRDVLWAQIQELESEQADSEASP